MTIDARDLRRRRRRADLLDLLFVTGGALMAGGVVIDWAGLDIAAAVVGGPGLVVTFCVVVFSGWWELDDQDFLMGSSWRRGARVRPLLPAGLAIVSTVLIVMSAIRIVSSDQSWFYRYVLATYWAIAGVVGLTHAVTRYKLRTRAPRNPA